MANKERTDYHYIVVPLDKDESEKAERRGITNTFCVDMATATEVMNRLNKYSGVIWRIKTTTDEVFNWNNLKY